MCESEREREREGGREGGRERERERERKRGRERECKSGMQKCQRQIKLHHCTNKLGVGLL